MRSYITVIIYLIPILLACSSKENRKEDNGDQIEFLIESLEHTLNVLPPKTVIELQLDSLGLVRIDEQEPSIRIELKYATTDNFTGNVLYEELKYAYLHPVAMKKLSEAQFLLKNKNPDFSLLVYDAARPLSVQQKMFDNVKDTKYREYVANPSRTGLHNYGMAVDLTICEENGKPLDMGTDFDYFGKEAGINREDEFVKNGLLSQEQVNNRKLLRHVMQQAGFTTIRGEWWHFNACSLSDAKNKYPVIK